MTRNLVLYELMSLDGFADDPGEGEWFGDADERLTDFLAEVIAGQDTVLLGRRTFEKWAPHWPTSTMQPFAEFISTTPKLVFSSKALTVDWSATTHVTEHAAPLVADMKQRSGGDIGVRGSLTLARTLLAEHLVDELRLVVAPSLAGRGHAAIRRRRGPAALRTAQRRPLRRLPAAPLSPPWLSPRSARRGANTLARCRAARRQSPVGVPRRRTARTCSRPPRPRASTNSPVPSRRVAKSRMNCTCASTSSGVHRSIAELGMELEGRAPIEGEWVDRVSGLDGVRVDIAMMRTRTATAGSS